MKAKCRPTASSDAAFAAAICSRASCPAAAVAAATSSSFAASSRCSAADLSRSSLSSARIAPIRCLTPAYTVCASSAPRCCSGCLAADAADADPAADPAPTLVLPLVGVSSGDAADGAWSLGNGSGNGGGGGGGGGWASAAAPRR